MFNVKGLRANLIAGVIGLLISLYVWVTTYSFPKDMINPVGADFFPRLMALGLAGASLTLMITGVVGRREEIFDKLDIKSGDFQRAVICLLLTIAMGLLMKPLGFIPAAVLYMYTMMFVLKNRSWIKMAIIAVALPIVVYKVFESFLGIILPLGILKDIIF